MNLKKLIVILVVIALVAGGAYFGYLCHKNYVAAQEKKADVDIDTPRIMEGDYDMILVDAAGCEYEILEGTFKAYYEYNVLAIERAYRNAEGLADFFDKVESSGHDVERFYISVDPATVTYEEFIAQRERFPASAFSVSIMPKPFDYWKSMSDDEYSEVMDRYDEFVQKLSERMNEPESPADYPKGYIENFDVYANYEYIVRNNALFEGEDHRLIGDMEVYLIAYKGISDYSVDEYNIAENIRSFRRLTSRIRKGKYDEPQLPKTEVVFIGDSVIGNYKNTSSVPGVVAGLSGAHAYNLGQGGAHSESFPDFVDTFLRAKKLKKDETIDGPNEYFDSEVERFYKEHKKKRDLVFVIYFGLNDYFSGKDVGTISDTEESDTYYGNIKSGIDKLRKAYPKARIIICSPARISSYEYGTEPHGENDNTLEDFVDAARALAGYNGAEVYDAYENAWDIDDSNEQEYIGDQVHPSNYGRFVLGRKILRYIAGVEDEEEE